MIRKTEYAVISLKALTNKHIGFGYRKEADGPKDSGWRLMYDRDESELDLVNPDKVYACEIGRLLNYFPELKEFLGEKKYTIVEEVDGGYTCKRISKDLSEVPHKMTGKSKYKTFMGGGGSHGGYIFTADPADMKHSRKEWEDLIPQ